MTRRSKALQLGWVTSLLDSSDKGLLERQGWWRHSAPHPPPLPSSPFVTTAPAACPPHLPHPSPLPPNFSRQLLRAGIIVTRQLSRRHFSLPSFLHLSHFLPRIHIFRDKCSPWILHLLSLDLFLPFPTFHPSSTLLPSVHAHVYSSSSSLCKCFTLLFFFLSPLFLVTSFHSSISLTPPLISANLMHFTRLESFPLYQSISSNPRFYPHTYFNNLLQRPLFVSKNEYFLGGL